MKYRNERRDIGMTSLPAIFRPLDLDELGIPRSRLRANVISGDWERVARGLYRIRTAAVTEHDTIALVCKRFPQAIVCLLTALHFYGIGTQAPREVWIALDRKARKSRHKDLPLRIVRFSAQMLRYAVVTRNIQGVPIRITTPARTVVDCFRYRKTVGLDVAIEALRDTLRRKQAGVDEIIRAAETCRVRTVIRPYIEAAVA